MDTNELWKKHKAPLLSGTETEWRSLCKDAKNSSIAGGTHLQYTLGVFESNRKQT